MSRKEIAKEMKKEIAEISKELEDSLYTEEHDSFLRGKICALEWALRLMD